jgi:hypothetical protein
MVQKAVGIIKQQQETTFGISTFRVEADGVGPYFFRLGSCSGFILGARAFWGLKFLQNRLGSLGSGFPKSMQKSGLGLTHPYLVLW